MNHCCFLPGLPAIGVALLLVLSFLPVRTPRGMPFADELQGPGWVWQAPEHFELSGVQLQVQRFSAPQPPAIVAQRLSDLPSRRLSRLQLAGQILTLSGLAQGKHWLVRLEPERGGTAGILSGLSPGAPARGHFDALRFAAGCTPRIPQRFVLADRALLTRLACAGTLAATYAQVSAALRAAGWRPMSSTPADGPTPSLDWQDPEGAMLAVLFEARMGRVLVTFLHRSKESP